MSIAFLVVGLLLLFMGVAGLYETKQVVIVRQYHAFKFTVNTVFLIVAGLLLIYFGTKEMLFIKANKKTEG